MDGKVSITITTDKSVKIQVSPQVENEKSDEDKKEAVGLKRLLREVKGGASHVVCKKETWASGAE